MGFSIGTTEGDIGTVKSFYFDEQTWTIRHLIVDAGGWLTSRQVLISPLSLRATDWMNRRLIANLTKDQVKNSPVIDQDESISRYFEIEYHRYYGYPSYWAGPHRWGPTEFPSEWSDMPRAHMAVIEAEEAERGSRHLRGTRDVIGYYIRATDGDIGHVEDFLIEDDTWAIRYMVVDTRNWLPGKKVIVSPAWIDRISWSDSVVYVNLQRERIKNSPEYDPSRSLERADETRLYDFYGRPTYWKDRDKAA